MLHRFLPFKKGPRLSQVAMPATTRDLISIYDVFYVCFDEPNRKENWADVKRKIPHAKKVEGVVGFDNALKTCARQSRTKHFFVIDGDNKVIDSRLDRVIPASDCQDQWVLSWSSMNPVNGLAYGNGGLKLWPADVALQMNSHENADSEDDQTDYCFIADYFLVDDYVTETIMNSNVTQAFRAGFREGVKMSLAWGKQVELNHDNFESMLGRQNRKRLKIWCEIGEDSNYGIWGILGARMGLKMNVVDQFDYDKINSYEWIDQCLQDEILQPLSLKIDDIEAQRWSRKAIDGALENLASEINRKIPLQIQNHTIEESLNFKREFVNPPRKGLLGRNPKA